MDVEDATALGVRQRPDAVLRREPRGAAVVSLSRSRARELRHRHEESSSRPVGGTHEPDGARWQPAGLQCRTQHVVDERRHGAERGAAGSQHGRVEALEKLPRHVERHVRTSLEVRADRPDGNPPLAHAQAVRERPRVDLAFERLDPAIASSCVARPSTRASSSRSRSSVPRRGARLLLDVERIGREHRRAPLAHERRCGRSASLTRSSASAGAASFAAPPRARCPRAGSLQFVYWPSVARHASLRIERLRTGL